MNKKRKETFQERVARLRGEIEKHGAKETGVMAAAVTLVSIRNWNRGFILGWWVADERRYFHQTREELHRQLDAAYDAAEQIQNFSAPGEEGN